MFVSQFDGKQKSRFFRCNPVSLIWRHLSPGVQIIRDGGSVGPNYAKEFEALAAQYAEWTKGADGTDFKTEAQQAVCALFA